MNNNLNFTWREYHDPNVLMACWPMKVDDSMKRPFAFYYKKEKILVLKERGYDYGDHSLIKFKVDNLEEADLIASKAIDATHA